MAEVYKVKTVGIAGFEKVQALKRILPQLGARGPVHPQLHRRGADRGRAHPPQHRPGVRLREGRRRAVPRDGADRGQGPAHRDGPGVARDLLLPIPVAAYIIAEVAAGLDYAHRKTDGYGGSLGIVHCDVSPSNVMLSTDGYVKILDFGIARATFASALERRRLRGKPRYMAPEQTLGEPPTPAADVFALGIIAWELFTGLPLYRGAEPQGDPRGGAHAPTPPRLDRLEPAGAGRDRRRGRDRAVARADARAAPRRISIAALRARPRCSAARARSPRGSPSSTPRPSKVDLPWQPENTLDQRAEAGAAHALVHAQPPDPDRAPVRALGDAVARATCRRPAATSARARRGSRRELPRRRPPRQRAMCDRPRSDRDRGPPRRRSATAAPRHAGPDREHVGAVGPRGHRGGQSACSPTPLPDASFQHREATVPTDLLLRPSYEVLQLGPGARPSALRFDDEATQPRVLAADRRARGHELRRARGRPRAARACRAAARRADRRRPRRDRRGRLAERRRAVVVAGAARGRAADVLRPVTRSLGELAYQRGGVVLAHDDDVAARRVRARGRRRGRRRDRDGLGARCRGDGARCQRRAEQPARRRGHRARASAPAPAWRPRRRPSRRRADPRRRDRRRARARARGLARAPAVRRRDRAA